MSLACCPAPSPAGRWRSRAMARFAQHAPGLRRPHHRRRPLALVARTGWLAPLTMTRSPPWRRRRPRRIGLVPLLELRLLVAGDHGGRPDEAGFPAARRSSPPLRARRGRRRTPDRPAQLVVEFSFVHWRCGETRSRSSIVDRYLALTVAGRTVARPWRRPGGGGAPHDERRPTARRRCRAPATRRRSRSGRRCCRRRARTCSVGRRSIGHLSARVAMAVEQLDHAGTTSASPASGGGDPEPTEAVVVASDRRPSGEEVVVEPTPLCGRTPARARPTPTTRRLRSRQRRVGHRDVADRAEQRSRAGRPSRRNRSRCRSVRSMSSVTTTRIVCRRTFRATYSSNPSSRDGRPSAIDRVMDRPEHPLDVYVVRAERDVDWARATLRTIAVPGGAGAGDQAGEIAVPGRELGEHPGGHHGHVTLRALGVRQARPSSSPCRRPGAPRAGESRCSA